MFVCVCEVSLLLERRRLTKNSLPALLEPSCKSSLASPSRSLLALLLVLSSWKISQRMVRQRHGKKDL